MSNVTATILFAACAVAISAGCDVALVQSSDGGKGGGAGADYGVGTGDGGTCPTGSDSRCTKNTDCGGSGWICVIQECGNVCRDTTTCPDYGAPAGQYCLKSAECAQGERCDWFDPARPECGGGCVEDVVLPDGGSPDAGTVPCSDLDFCDCFAASDRCEYVANGCICPCDYNCPGVPPCACACGGGDYLGCRDRGASTDAGYPDAGYLDAGTAPGGAGSRCIGDADCPGGGCLAEQSGYPSGGYCTGGVCDIFSNPDVCGAGAICLPMDFAQAPGLCMAACAGDADCRDGLTCEAMPISARYYGQPLFCWQSGASLGKGLGEPCKDGTECITRYCEASGAGSVKVCSAFCSKGEPCKSEMVCASSPNCRTQPPDCGMCVYPVK